MGMGAEAEKRRRRRRRRRKRKKKEKEKRKTCAGLTSDLERKREEELLVNNKHLENKLQDLKERERFGKENDYERRQCIGGEFYYWKQLSNFERSRSWFQMGSLARIVRRGGLRHLQEVMVLRHFRSTPKGLE
ncbi:hypothetical protein Droror1_Dr00011933 [Drosera rotundifolia]